MAERGGPPGFRGDLGWLHDREGHVGRPYWPGGMSGVTLDPGLDLGQAPVQVAEKLIRPLVTTDQWMALWRSIGIKGQKARRLLEASNMLASVRISRDVASVLLPLVALPFWLALCRRFPDLPEAPPAVQTAMLSLGYNRGPGNRDLEVLAEPLGLEDWREVGELIKAMQQDHRLEGIRSRRRLEGDLILDSLGEAAWVT